MIVEVNVDPAGVSLQECDVLNRFHVRSSADASAVGEALAEHGRAADKPEHVWVRIESLRALAAGQVSGDWTERFDAMVAYAKTKGWLDEDGTHLMAHVERP